MVDLKTENLDNENNENLDENLDNENNENLDENLDNENNEADKYVTVDQFNILNQNMQALMKSIVDNQEPEKSKKEDKKVNEKPMTKSEMQEFLDARDAKKAQEAKQEALKIAEENEKKEKLALVTSLTDDHKKTLKAANINIENSSSSELSNYLTLLGVNTNKKHYHDLDINQKSSNSNSNWSARTTNAVKELNDAYNTKKY